MSPDGQQSGASWQSRAVTEKDAVPHSRSRSDHITESADLAIEMAPAVAETTGGPVLVYLNSE